jgi:predicted nucleotidyltransferase
MKNIADIKAILSAQRRVLHDRYRVKHLEIFGSYARNEQTERSDLDLLVDFEEMVGLMHITELQYHLEELLGMQVDLVTRPALKPYMSAQIMSEAVAV